MSSLQGQLRVGGMGAVMGVDFNAAFRMADALGVNSRAVAELLPAIEAGLVRGHAKAREDDDGLDGRSAVAGSLVEG